MHRSVVLTLATALLAGAALVSVAAAGGRPLEATLLGANEVPGPGDPDGSGTAHVELNHGQGTVCYTVTVTGIAPATAAHIHAGAAGTAGPVVVALTPPTDGSSSGCVSGVDRDLIKAIIQDPASFYVNVHNAEYPAGALRGQLAR